MSFAPKKTTVTSGTFLFFLCLLPSNMENKQIKTKSNDTLRSFLCLLTLPQRKEETAVIFAALSFSSPSWDSFSTSITSMMSVGLQLSLCWSCSLELSCSLKLFRVSKRSFVHSRVFSSWASTWDSFTLCCRFLVQAELWTGLFSAQTYSTQVQRY